MQLERLVDSREYFCENNLKSGMFRMKQETQNLDSTHPETLNNSNIQWDIIFWTCVIVVVSVLIFSAFFKSFKPVQLIYLANSFTHGRISVDEMPLLYPDYVIRNGHTYLPFGPLAAIALIPFLPLIKLGYQPGLVSIIFTLVNVWLLNRILIKIGLMFDKRKWILLLFFGGTVYLSVAATMLSWYFSHIVATFCMLVAISGSFYNHKPVVIGFFVGLAAATRLSLIFSLPFFLMFYWKNQFFIKDNLFWKKLLKTIIPIIIGVSIPLFTVLVYNFARFGNPLETGYGITILGSKELEVARSYGLFSLFHIPRNLFFLMLQGPLPFPEINSPLFRFPFIKPSPLGMGILFTSPALIFALKRKKNDHLVRNSWFGLGFVLIPLMTHFGTGWVQFGFRYSLDFMPFLIVIVSCKLSNIMGNIERSLIVVSVLINLWGTAWLHSWL
jgi:hypothetical protein